MSIFRLIAFVLALIIRIGSWGPLYYNYNKDPKPKTQVIRNCLLYKDSLKARGMWCKQGGPTGNPQLRLRARWPIKVWEGFLSLVFSFFSLVFSFFRLVFSFLGWFFRAF